MAPLAPTELMPALASLWWHSAGINSVGASGAIFGLYGFLLALLVSKRLVLNKSDAMTPREAQSRRTALSKAAGQPVMLLSGVTGDHLPDVLRTLMIRVHENRSQPAALEIA